jgi:DNA polymerase-3 subunit epsilon
MDSTKYVVVDVETTGLGVQRGGRVIEVGAVAIETGIIGAEFGSLIDSGAVISYHAYRHDY